MVRKLDIDGDAQADLTRPRWGAARRIRLQMDSARYWEGVFWAAVIFTFGQFGENFTVEGLADNDVCIAAIATALVVLNLK